VEFQIDAVRRNIENPVDEIRHLVSTQYKYGERLSADYDAIFVTNPTSLHYEALSMYCNNAKWFFVEKPVFDHVNAECDLLPKNCYVACPLRYTSVIKYIKENINYKSAFSARAISSSYLPEWRPNKDYRETYSAHKTLGGGVSIDLIHEWDYISNLFGFPKNVYSIMGKFSNLEIDSDDLAVYIGEYPDKLVELHLDYFGRFPVRKLEIFFDGETIEADFLSCTIKHLKSGKAVSLCESRDSYQTKEIEHFFKIMRGELQNDSTIEDAVKVLKIARGE
jgi:predicted dehydrogenase